ncbi:MAG: DUF4382 domain-containing protein [Crocinitomicaceae bacterium]|nr:DUF4382 domain-containing protein [Crocinitomicaceae bacterium]
MKKIAFITTVTLIILGLGLTNCEKDNPNLEPGEFSVRMTDAPADYTELNVEIASIEAYNQNSGWVMLNSNTQAINVLDYKNGAEVELAHVSKATAGTYTQLKITFGSDNSLTYEKKTEIGGIVAYAEVTTQLQWDGPKEIFISIEEEISSEQSAELLLDFNAAASIKRSADNYVLDPVITVLEDAKTGLEGRVTGATNAMVMITDNESSLTTYINMEGEFLFRGLKEGAYDVIVYPGSDEINNGAQSEIIIQNVLVREGEIRNMGTINIGS